ncbi:MAG: DUF3014 domain-containing protein [Oceanicoccus sp.]
MVNKLFPKLVIGVGAVAVLAIGWFIYSSEQQSQIEPADTTQNAIADNQLPQESLPAYSSDDVSIDEPEPINIEPIDDIVIAPVVLENSDPQVLLAIADLSPSLTQWLIPEEQLRKWVLSVDLVADGKLPKRYRPIDYPMVKFVTKTLADDAILSEKNYPRMNDLLAATITIDPELLARYYQNWLPILEKAYSEQGRSDSFDQRFQQAISQTLAASSLTEEPALVRPSVLYRYANPDYENATDVEKLLWRMGPDNAEKVQDFLREFRNQLPR